MSLSLGQSIWTKMCLDVLGPMKENIYIFIKLLELEPTAGGDNVQLRAGWILKVFDVFLGGFFAWVKQGFNQQGGSQGCMWWAQVSGPRGPWGSPGTFSRSRSPTWNSPSRSFALKSCAKGLSWGLPGVRCWHGKPALPFCSGQRLYPRIAWEVLAEGAGATVSATERTDGLESDRREKWETWARTCEMFVDWLCPQHAGKAAPTSAIHRPPAPTQSTWQTLPNTSLNSRGITFAEQRL